MFPEQLCYINISVTYNRPQFRRTDGYVLVILVGTNEDRLAVGAPFAQWSQWIMSWIQGCIGLCIWIA
jgi:hypothetical protein